MTYYVTATNSVGLVTTDPATAPTNTYSYTVQTTQATNLSVAGSASNTYGGTTILTATLTFSASTVISNEPITFSLNGTSVGTATTNTSGVATLSGVSLAGINVGTTSIVATFAGDTTYAASSAAASLTITARPITVTSAASVSSNPVTGTTAALSVLGTDSTGSSNLTYTWTTITLPSSAATPTFSVNGTNAAKNTTVTFSTLGTYVFLATIAAPNDLTATSSVSVTLSGRTWIGGTGANLATAANWSGGTAPQSGDILVLPVSTTASFVNGLPATITLHGIVVQSGTVSISGNSFATDSTGLTVSVAAGAALQLGVAITGPGALRQTGGGTLTLQSAGSFSGGLTVAGGTVVAASPASLPSGSSFNVGSGGTLVLLGGSLPSGLSSTTSSAATVSAMNRIPVLCPAVWVVHQNPLSSAACLAAGGVGQSANLQATARAADLSETRPLGNLTRDSLIAPLRTTSRSAMTIDPLIVAQIDLSNIFEQPMGRILGPGDLNALLDTLMGKQANNLS